MTPDRPLLTRPRTAGEILDDAWRLALADFPLLFGLAGLFLVPFFAVFLLLFALPKPDGWSARLLTAIAAALLAALTGVGSGACQDLFRHRTAGETATFGRCLKAALRRGFDHAAARAMLLPTILLGIGCLILPGVTLWMACPAVHTLIAEGKGRNSADLNELGREVRFNPSKAAAVILTRLPLLALAVINLHLLGVMALWAAGNLAGFDVALVSFAMTLGNPVYLLALTLFAWLLLTPYFEAGNFLLHLDTRTRQEGLDLFYRVRRCFPTGETNLNKVLPVLVAVLLCAAPAAAADPVGVARVEVSHIAQEVKTEATYRGSDQLAEQLGKVADRLEEAGGKAQFAWFRRRLALLVGVEREGALDLLADLDRRLARMEGATGGLSKDELKGLLRPGRDDEDASEPAHKREKEPQREEPPEVKRDVDAPQGRRSGSGSPAAGPPGGGNAGEMLVGGLLVALVVAALLLWLRNRTPAPEKAAETTAGKSPPRDHLPRPDEAAAPSLWRRAEELAVKGEYLEALRALYGAVLAVLHRRHFIRYEMPRTNGEYVEQVRLAAEAPPELRGPFERLTALFEWKWYGERACDDSDFAAGRRLAEEIRGN